MNIRETVLKDINGTDTLTHSYTGSRRIVLLGLFRQELRYLFQKLGYRIETGVGSMEELSCRVDDLYLDHKDTMDGWFGGLDMLSPQMTIVLVYSSKQEQLKDFMKLSINGKLVYRYFFRQHGFNAEEQMRRFQGEFHLFCERLLHLKNPIIPIDYGNNKEVVETLSRIAQQTRESVAIHYQPPIHRILMSILVTSHSQIEWKIPESYQPFIETLELNSDSHHKSTLQSIVKDPIASLATGQLVICVERTISQYEIELLIDQLEAFPREELYYQSSDECTKMGDRWTCFSQYLFLRWRRDVINNTEKTSYLLKPKKLVSELDYGRGSNNDVEVSMLKEASIIHSENESIVSIQAPSPEYLSSIIYEGMKSFLESESTLQLKYILFIFLDQHLLDLAENLIQSVILSGLDLVVFSFHQEVLDRLTKYRVRLVDMTRDSSPQQNMSREAPNLKGKLSHEAPNLKGKLSFVFQKFYLTDRLLELDKVIIYIDVDVVVLSSHIDRLAERLKANNYDMMVQSTTGCNYCTGFFAVMPNEKTRQIFRIDPEVTSYFFGGDQHYFNHLLSYKLRILRLAPWNYPNGKFFKMNYQTLKPRLVHYNCFNNLSEKIQFIRYHRLWLKDLEGRCQIYADQVSLPPFTKLKQRLGLLFNLKEVDLSGEKEDEMATNSHIVIVSDKLTKKLKEDKTTTYLIRGKYRDRFTGSSFIEITENADRTLLDINEPARLINQLCWKVLSYPKTVVNELKQKIK